MNIERIIIDQKVHFGKPCIAGTRIPVYCVLELVQAGVTFDEIVSKYYPDITLDDIKACGACLKTSKISKLVMLNLFQHLIKSKCYETLKQVQGDN